MKVITSIIYGLFAVFGYSQSNVKEINLINKERINFMSVHKEFGNIEKTKDDKGVWQFQFKTLSEPKFIYNCSSKFPIVSRNAKKGSVFLLSFKAKTVEASLETGEAKALFILKQTGDYKGNIDYTQSFSSEWQTYYLPFEADRFISKENLAIVMQYGFRQQTFILKDIKFEMFPEGTIIEQLPKTEITYQGIEVDADWRAKAKARIEAIRKGEITLQFLKKGVPVTNKIVNLKLVNHAFPFGAKLNAEDVVNNTDDYKNFKKGFNSIVLGNDLKIKAWSKEKKRKTTLKALDILKADGYTVKGHVLVWPGFNYLTKDFRIHKENSEKLTQLIDNHINSILDGTKGKITHWDVVNEAYTNRDLQNITGGEQILYNAFKTVAQKQPRIKRFTNEYGIISKGGVDSQKQQWYYDYIKRLDKNTGGLVQGIGIQSHMGSDLTPPKRVLEILSFYATLGKQISISEFTMDVQDSKVREQYTRDFMIAAFSHPNVSEFLFWGNTEDEGRKCDIFTTDNEIGVMGKAYFSLVYDAWRTNLNKKTSEDGMISGRGFFGTYEYSFVEDGEVVTGSFQLKPKQTNFYKIKL